MQPHSLHGEKKSFPLTAAELSSHNRAYIFLKSEQTNSLTALYRKRFWTPTSNEQPLSKQRVQPNLTFKARSFETHDSGNETAH